MTVRITFWCWRCGSGHIRRAHRQNIMERILSLAILPYRCETCDLRFYGPRGFGARRVIRPHQLTTAIE